MKYTMLIASVLIVLINGCGSTKHGKSSLHNEPTYDYSNTYVYRENSPYKDVLLSCIRADASHTCTLEKLPLIGEHGNPVTKEAIMQRLVVSHAWMAQRFETLLERYKDKDIWPLFGAVTAVVIDDSIAVPHYKETGAIYLSPDYLWLTQEEKQTIAAGGDFRQNYGDSLRFVVGDTMIVNGRDLYDLPNDHRTVDDLEPLLASLLYHELSHANDFFPPEQRDGYDRGERVHHLIQAYDSQSVSASLVQYSPLLSHELKGIGEVLYQGETPDDTQRAMRAEEAGAYFEEDAAAMMYAYADRYEDMATLFESAMMMYHYHATPITLLVDTTRDEPDVAWGVGNALLRDTTRQRAIFVATRILPEGGWSQKLHALPGSVRYFDASGNATFFHETSAFAYRPRLNLFMGRWR